MKKPFAEGKAKKSIRRQINQFNLIAMTIVVVVLLSYHVLNVITVDKYNNALRNYSNLSNFYQTLDKANGSFKDYLYTQSNRSLNAYDEHITTAYRNLINLESTIDGNEEWRVALLINMMDSYVEKAEVTKNVFLEEEAGSSYANEYSELLVTFELINKTGDEYYTLMTEEMEIQSNQFNQMERSLAIISSILAGLVVLWLFYYAYRTMQLITRPLGDMVKNIKGIKRGEYDLSEIANTGSEMHELCAALDEMADVVQKEILMTKANASLEKRLLETENENLRKDEMLAQSEVKMLQNQINPHFLFNTLNMTYRLAIQENAVRCSEMIERTSALLRYGLDKQNKLSDLFSEIEAVKNYIAIQEKRLGDRVHFELFVADDLPNLSIPGMIVQPLIENALKHGLKDCIEEGEIVTAFRYMDGFVYIQISDNGMGMDSTANEEMQLNHFHDKEGDHLGLYNVVKRLEMFFHENVAISVNSATDCGFEFVIKIEV